MFKDGFEICHLHSGDYFGATVVLGVHRTYPYSYRAKTMCHMLQPDRQTLMGAVGRYRVARQWLSACREREEFEFEDSRRSLRERLQKVRLQKHLRRHLGRLFPNMRHIFLGSESPQMMLRMCLKSWANVCRELSQRKRAASMLDKATRGQIRAPLRAGAMIMGNNIPREGSPLPTPVEMLRLPAIPQAQDAMSSPDSQN